MLLSLQDDRHKMIPYTLFTLLIVLIHLGGTSAILYLLLAVSIVYISVKSISKIIGVPGVWVGWGEVMWVGGRGVGVRGVCVRICGCVFIE